MSDHPNHGRRRFVKLSAIGIASAPLLGRVALAQDKVDESSETAKSLSYKHDATQIENHKEGQLCSNCQLFQGSEGDEWGGCAIFGNQLVNANGWCTAWVPKA
ncbi:MAG: high-potential iron-sulfur protein [Candidatus Competibacterales bacterium]|nr:high-potential iron-sulfur protein [Candidatus Competibacterales bacterium]